MKSERLQILSLAYSGQLAQEEADLQLARLGKRERHAFRLILFAVVLVTVTAVVLIFHLEDKIRFMAGSAMQTLEGFPIFREVYAFVRRILDAI